MISEKLEILKIIYRYKPFKAKKMDNFINTKCDDPQPIFSLLHIRADDPYCIFC